MRRGRGPSELLNVWTFSLALTHDFVNDLARRPTTTSNLLFMTLATRRRLARLKLEEYWSRIRIHRWLGHVEGDTDEPTVYEWWDTRGLSEANIWSYGDESRGARFDLRGRWVDIEEKRGYYELAGQVVRPAQVAGEDNPTVTLFSVPLNSRVLDRMFMYDCGWKGGRLLDGGWEWHISVTEIDPLDLLSKRWLEERGRISR
jgi:hypothetical protein